MDKESANEAGMWRTDELGPGHCSDMPCLDGPRTNQKLPSDFMPTQQGCEEHQHSGSVGSVNPSEISKDIKNEAREGRAVRGCGQGNLVAAWIKMQSVQTLAPRGRVAYQMRPTSEHGQMPGVVEGCVAAIEVVFSTAFGGQASLRRMHLSTDLNWQT